MQVATLFPRTQEIGSSGYREEYHPEKPGGPLTALQAAICVGGRRDCKQCDLSQLKLWVMLRRKKLVVEGDTKDGSTNFNACQEYERLSSFATVKIAPQMLRKSIANPPMNINTP